MPDPSFTARRHAVLSAGPTDARSAAQSAVLFGAMGLAAGAIVSDLIHAGCFDDDGPLRCAAALLAPLGMAAAGGVIGGFAERGRGARWALVSAAVMVVMGALVGAIAVFMNWRSPGWVAIGFQCGMVFGAAAFVMSAPVLFFTGRLERVRARSVAARSRRIVTWCAAGLSIASGPVLAIAMSRPVATCERAADGTTLHAVAIAGALFSLLGASASAWTASRARRLCVSPLERAAGPLGAGPTTVDLGIGEGLWMAPRNVAPYRHAFAQRADVVGDPLATLRSLRDDEVQAIGCAAGALAVAALSFAMMPPHVSRPPALPPGVVAAAISGAASAGVAVAARASAPDEDISPADEDMARRSR